MSFIGIELFPDIFISLELAIAYHVNEALALGFNHMLLFRKLSNYGEQDRGCPQTTFTFSNLYSIIIYFFIHFISFRSIVISSNLKKARRTDQPTDGRNSGLRRSCVPSRPAGRDPGRDGTGFFKGIFEKTCPVEMVQKTFGIASLISKILTHSLNTFIKILFREINKSSSETYFEWIDKLKCGWTFKI